MPELSFRLLINLFAALGAGFALWKGGHAERATALVLIANVAIGQAGKAFAPESDDVIRLVNDGLTAIVLLAITIRYGALWMGGAMLFFAAQFAMHSYYLVMRRPSDYFSSAINNVNFSGVVWCLIIGTAVAWRYRVRRARATREAAT
jgi:hypothetical protein